MPASTPLAHSKSAALTRVTDSIPKGYSRYTFGTVAATKAVALAHKLHGLYGIGCTPAQRITRKKHGQANALLVMYWPEDADLVHWLMLFTVGEGAEREQLRDVTAKPYLQWLGYELVRHPTRGATSWTWRRPKAEMAEHYAMLAELQKKHHTGAVSDMLQRLANQPGFHGVRTQTWDLFQVARQRGYDAALPHLFYIQKIPHGDSLLVGD